MARDSAMTVSQPPPSAYWLTRCDDADFHVRFYRVTHG
jgi:hypothetical protein